MQFRALPLIRLGFAAIVGLSYPYLELAWKCRAVAATSEGCAWGRAYFPITRWIEPLVVAPVAFLVITVLFRLLDGRKPPA